MATKIHKPTLLTVAQVPSREWYRRSDARSSILCIDGGGGLVHHEVRCSKVSLRKENTKTTPKLYVLRRKKRRAARVRCHTWHIPELGQGFTMNFGQYSLVGTFVQVFFKSACVTFDKARTPHQAFFTYLARDHDIHHPRRVW